MAGLRIGSSLLRSEEENGGRTRFAFRWVRVRFGQIIKATENESFSVAFIGISYTIGYNATQLRGALHSLNG